MKLVILVLVACLAWGLAACGSDDGGQQQMTGPGPNPVDSCDASQLADHVLITKVGTTPTTAEFVEIYNPTSSQINLSDYYLYNATNPSSPTCRYYNAAAPGACGTNSLDFILRFPSGASILAGEYQVIALTSAGAFCETLYPGMQCPLPDYEVPGNGRDVAAVINMRGTWDTDPDAFVRFGFLDNASEELVLFKWDGGSTLVEDIDYVVWGTSQDYRTDKTGVATYRADTPVAQQKPMHGSIASRKTYQRICLSERGETKTNGNGITAHNETSEDLSKSFVIADPTPGAATVGVEP